MGTSYIKCKLKSYSYAVLALLHLVFIKLVALPPATQSYNGYPSETELSHHWKPHYPSTLYETFYRDFWTIWIFHVLRFSSQRGLTVLPIKNKYKEYSCRRMRNKKILETSFLHESEEDSELKTLTKMLTEIFFLSGSRWVHGLHWCQVDLI